MLMMLNGIDYRSETGIVLFEKEKPNSIPMEHDIKLTKKISQTGLL